LVPFWREYAIAFHSKALHDHRARRRARRGRGNVIMPEIAYSLDEDDAKAIAHFMSRQGADTKP
jgi:cytochrome c553